MEEVPGFAGDAGRFAPFIIMSWLRVFRSPETAHLGHGVGHGWQMKTVPSEKSVARRGRVSDERRMITASFTRALQRSTGRIRMHFLPIFQEVKPMSTTRNQFPLIGTQLFRLKLPGSCSKWA
jgi:hypothetical protein